MSGGRLYGVGVGPGNPELLTLKAARLLREVGVIGSISANGEPSLARTIAAAHIPADRREITITLPMRQEAAARQAAYDEGADRLGSELEAGLDVVMLCEGDPLLFGSFAEVLDRLRGRFETEIVPGVTSFVATAAAARLPLTQGNQLLLVLPATAAREQLERAVAGPAALAILKAGRHLDGLRDLLRQYDRLDGAIFGERVTTQAQVLRPLAGLEPGPRSYFSLVLVPARGR